MIPRATLRLQFHKGFTFADAEALVPYFSALGVSHIYASPIMAARAGSLHGYDVVDPTRVNPELGGEDALKRMVDALHRADLGLIIDIVPNHMAASLENAWWADVLRNGRDSRYAGFFDIDWESEDPVLAGKVFLPVLDRPLQEVVDAGEIVAERRDGRDYLRYRDLLLPARGTDLEHQPWRLGWWRTSGDRINWRRFFDINDLVCLRMEDDEAFEAVHATIARLYAEGTIVGVRVDHVDGLYDPAEYCRRLRHRLDPQVPERPYLVVEKILLRGEALPRSWACDGTTGYDFMDEASALQHDPAGEAILGAVWAAISGRPADFATEERAARREIISRSFSAQLDACAAAFERLAKRESPSTDLSRPALRRTLVELLVNFPVYRSYATASERPAADRPFLDRAAEGAKVTGLAGDRWVVNQVHRWLSAPAADHTPIARFQQLSAPVAAKSVEDTAFYRYGRLLSRNDVGFDIERFGCSPGEFHARMLRRLDEFPHSLLATATHDHKRGEDVRGRLAVLSECPRQWAEHVADWISRSAPLRSDGHPVAADIATLLQMIVGAWPLDLALDDAAGRASFAERLANWQEKALREAKLHSNWADPNTEYEAAACRFLMHLLADAARPELLADIFGFVEAIAAPAAVNSLAQLLLKLTVPGVPDIYQGTDDWDFSLVDPDNRRPVDYGRRQSTLAALRAMPASDQWRTGGLKQAVIARTLALRRALPALFDNGGYEPVAVEGPMAEHVVAFMRRHGADVALTVVPRLPTRLLATQDGLVLDPDIWQGTTLLVATRTELFSAFDGASASFDKQNVALQHMLREPPIALFSTRRPF